MKLELSIMFCAAGRNRNAWDSDEANMKNKQGFLHLD